MMTRIKILLALSLLVGASSGLARPPGPPPLEERLKLTPEQKPKVEEILREQREKMQALRAETRERLKEVLTEEQAAKLEHLREEKKQRWRKLRQRFSQD
jgi:Spy/CpxP family protein refolding chaperone